jgi:hypothetical protein
VKCHAYLGGTHNSLRWRATTLGPFSKANARLQLSLSLVAQNPCCLIRFTVIAATTFQDKEGQIHRSLAETLIVLLEHSHHHLSSDAAKTRRDSHGAAAESRQRSGQSHESQVCYFATS